MKPGGSKMVSILAIVLFIFGEIALLFFTPREEFLQMIIVYAALFTAYLILYHDLRNIRTAAFLGVGFRLIAWVAFPSFSDDIYRFIWDGSTILHGISPYELTPTELLPTLLHEPFESLYPKLNSTGYYSVYPSIIQLAATFAALSGNDFFLAALILKLPLLLAEITSIWMLPNLLMRFNVSPKYSVLYMLNPLIIVDVLANAHFELLMTFFLLLMFNYLNKQRIVYAGMALAASIVTKLIPLLFLPFIAKSLSRKEAITFIATTTFATLLLSIPLLNAEAFSHFTESLRLYVQTFEFNASIYYVAKSIGETLIGYNPIQYIGPLLSALSLLMMVLIWIKQEPNDHRAALRSMLWTLSIYLVFSTTVHSWYVAPLIVLGILSRRYYPLVWSALIIISYSAYDTQPVHEHWPLILMEYLMVLIAFLYPSQTRRLIMDRLRNL